MKQRNFVVGIILTIITCGIYGLYWMVQINNDINQLSGETEATSGGKVLLFALLTCGIYTIYWMYKMGERVDKIKGNDGNTNILFLVLTIIGLGIVNYCIMQDTVNKKLSVA